MTTEEFKKDNPQYAEIEGTDLWNAMEDSMLKNRKKHYQLRYLFYRILPNIVFGLKDYESNTRCKVCKKSGAYGFYYQGKLMCGDHEYQSEPNTSTKHRLYLIWKSITNLFWTILEKVHIVRSAYDGRYSLFGDESMYVKQFTINIETGKTTYEFKKRKWWEYIIIETQK